jgi:hypothetical protein
MLTVDLDQLDRWRSELADYPGVVRSLNEIEDCDGDVEDAAINLALHAGLEPDNGNQWLLSYTKRYRVAICQLQAQAEQPLAVTDIVRYLKDNSSCPALLVLPVAFAAQQQGLEAFCDALRVTRTDLS